MLIFHRTPGGGNRSDRAKAFSEMAEKHVFWDYFFQRCRKEVSEAVSDMAHTFYVFPEQLGASFRLQTFL